jgi:hypothetical protein
LGESEAGLELFFQHTPMTLARWPNEGFAKIPKVIFLAAQRRYVLARRRKPRVRDFANALSRVAATQMT